MTAPLRARFGAVYCLDYYGLAVILKVDARVGGIMGYKARFYSPYSQLNEKVRGKMKTKGNRQREMKKEMMKRAWKGFLFILPALLGFMALAISLSFGFFIIGFSGVIVVVRKEMPSGLVTVRGPIAVVTGSIFTILFWGIAVTFFLNGF